MPVTDSIADFLTRIRNAIQAKKLFVEIPASNTKREISRILLENKYIESFDFIEDNKQGILKLKLKYIAGTSSIAGLKKISTPGLRKYRKSDEIKPVFNGLGIAIISTSQGLMTDKEAKQKKIGGELICEVW